MSNYDMQSLEKGLGELKIVLKEQQKEQFVCYYELLAEWNQFMNLTAITEWEEVVRKHFIDSLSLIKVLQPLENLALIDIGTGAGFPGIPLKIAFPELRVTLLDSLQKRVKFLQEVTDRLELKDISALHGRAEDYARPGRLREQYDVCVSRAVSNLSVLSELCLPYVREGGYFIAYKSEKAAEELKTADGAITLLGGVIEKQETFYLPDSDMLRNLCVIRKIKKTPGKYPRKAGLPSREPIGQCKNN